MTKKHQVTCPRSCGEIWSQKKERALDFEARGRVSCPSSSVT